MNGKPSASAENVSFLRSWFAQRVAALAPASVLDVGAGTGATVAALQRLGLTVVGAEPDGDEALVAAHARLPTVRAEAERLPCGNGSFDWVTMRHVPHHLTDPAVAFAEAARVCRRGLALAEPWFDPGLACQRNAEAADRWLKRQHRRAGQVHHDAMGADALRRALPAPATWRLEVHTALRLRRRPFADLAAEAEPLLATLPANDPDRGAWRRLADAVAAEGLSFNGTLLLIARRRDRD